MQGMQADTLYSCLTHSVFIIVLIVEYLLLLALYRSRGHSRGLLALDGLIKREITEQQLLPLSHVLLWIRTAHDSRIKNNNNTRLQLKEEL